MAENVPPNPNANQANPLAPAWRVRTPLNLAPPVHAFVYNYEKAFPIFEPGEGISMDDHIQVFSWFWKHWQLNMRMWFVGFSLILSKEKKCPGILVYKPIQSLIGTPRKNV